MWASLVVAELFIPPERSATSRMRRPRAWTALRARSSRSVVRHAPAPRALTKSGLQSATAHQASRHAPAPGAPSCGSNAPALLPFVSRRRRAGLAVHPNLRCTCQRMAIECAASRPHSYWNPLQVSFGVRRMPLVGMVLCGARVVRAGPLTWQVTVAGRDRLCLRALGRSRAKSRRESAVAGRAR